MNKRAAVLVSFSWIFMIIVGSFFILFAYNIISKYQDSEEAKQELEFEISLQSIFKKVGYGKGSETTSLEKMNFIFKDSRVELFCESGFPLLSVNGNIDPTNNYLRNYPFFMTVIEQDSVDETYIAVEEFDLPFYITPLMALVSERNLYVFDQEIWDTTFRDKFSKTSAFKGLNTQVINFFNSDGTPNTQELDELINSIKDLELNSVTFVSSEQKYLNIILPNSMSQIQRINIAITQNQISQSYSSSSFEYKTGDIIYKDTSYWESDLSSEYTFAYSDLKKSMSLPTFAIFSTPESFSCGIYTIEELLTSVYSYYIEKTQVLLDEVSVSTQEGKFCSKSVNPLNIPIYYQNMLDNLKNIKNEEDRFKNIDRLNNLLYELWKSEIILERNNCIDVY